MLRRLAVVLAVLPLAVACSSTAPEEPVADGRLVAALSMPALAHDVAFFEVKVVAADGTCEDPGMIDPKVVPVEDEYLPLWLETDAQGGAFHPFGDALFVLQPGLYTVCAQPLDAAGEPSAECAAVATDEPVEVVPGQTTEIVLYANCVGDPSGALDVVVALNDPPHIDGLTLDPSKFITICQDVTVTVEASDPNGDALTYTWEIIESPAGTGVLPLSGPTVTSPPTDIPGKYVVKVTVSDGHGGTASLTFPVHISDAECCGDGACTGVFGETCLSCPQDCGGCEGDCCVDNGSVGCDDAACTEVVCAADPFCCGTSWDQICADGAAILCDPLCEPEIGLCPPDALQGGQCAPNAQCVFEPFCCPDPFGDVCAQGGCGCGDDGTWQCALPSLICPEVCPAEPPADGEACSGAAPSSCDYGEQCCPDGSCAPTSSCSCGPNGWECFQLILDCFEPTCAPLAPGAGTSCLVEGQMCFYDAADALCCDPSIVCDLPETVYTCVGSAWATDASGPFCPSP